MGYLAAERTGGPSPCWGCVPPAPPVRAPFFFVFFIFYFFLFVPQCPCLVFLMQGQWWCDSSWGSPPCRLFRPFSVSWVQWTRGIPHPR